MKSLQYCKDRTVSAIKAAAALVLLIVLAGCPTSGGDDDSGQPTSVPVAVTGVTLDAASVSLGTTWQLTASVSPADAANKAVTWSSSDPSKASVSTDGLVTALASSGTVTVTVTTADGGHAASCTVNLRAPDVYVTGYIVQGSQSAAGYWKNGTWNELASTDAFEIEAIYVYNEDVYAAGVQITDGWSTAGYWKNGVWNSLPKIVAEGHATPCGVYADGSKVLLAGSSYWSTEESSAWPVYWENGTLREIARVADDSSWGLRGLLVRDGNVYIPGYCQGDTYGFRVGYWKNYEWTTLPEHIAGQSIELYALAADGSGVYASGRTYPWPPYAVYWTNGASAAMSGTDTVTSTARDIAVSGGSVYIAGYYLPTNAYPAIPCYWKDNVKTDLAVPSGIPAAEARIESERIQIAVWNAVVYVAASVGGNSGTTGSPCLWADGTLTELPAAANCRYIVTDVFLK